MLFRFASLQRQEQPLAYRADPFQGESMPHDERTLTDADVQAIAEALESRISDRLVRKAGSGLIALAWRGFLLAIILLAAYGVTHGGSR